MKYSNSFSCNLPPTKGNVVEYMALLVNIELEGSGLEHPKTFGNMAHPKLV